LIRVVERGGLYLADLSPRRGTEPGKTRPVLVVQSDLLNGVGHPSTFVLPCTSRLAGESLLRVPLPRRLAGSPADCEVMIDQGRAIDNRRLRRRLGSLPPVLMREVNEKLRRLLEL
jgi:mRNA interferase MazF